MNVIEINKYIIEVISRIHTIKRRCETYFYDEFPSEQPIKLLKTFINICDFFERRIKESLNQDDIQNIFKYLQDQQNQDINYVKQKLRESFEHIQDIDYVIRELGAYLRFIEGAKTQRVPWSSIELFENIAQKLLTENTKVMLRAKWHYNYTVMMMDMKEVFDNFMKGFPAPDNELKNVLKELGEHFYIVSFPQLERTNILLHCLVGHEIGHLAINKYIETEEKKFLKRIRNDIETFVKNTNMAVLEEEYYSQKALRYWRRGLEEILSDIIGALLFGPAMLFSLIEISTQFKGLYDCPRENNKYYPPWLLRIKCVYEQIKEFFNEDLLNKFGNYSNPIQEYQKFVDNLIKTITYENIDTFIKLEGEIEKIVNEEKIEKPILEIAYNDITHHLDKYISDFKENLSQKGLILNPDNLYKILPELIERIEIGIPPNAKEKILDNRETASLPQIINAAWFYKIYKTKGISFIKDKLDKDKLDKTILQAIEDRKKVNYLTLKAMEYSKIENEWKK
jgi:hypothetical protein